MEVESTSNLDWDSLKVSKRDAYLLMASQVIELMNTEKSKEVIAATLTHLLVENFMLNLEHLG